MLIDNKASAWADPALVIRGEPNSEDFLSNLRKLSKKGKFFLTTQSLISEKKLSLYKPIYKNLFLIKENVYLLNTFLGRFFLKTKPGVDPEISRREGGELI